MKPVLQALLLADRVYRDESSKKFIIAGTFTKFFFAKTPPLKEVQLPDGSKRMLLAGGLQAGSPYLYLNLTDVCDGTKLTIQFSNLGSQQIFFGMEVVLNCNDRLETVEAALALPMLPIGTKGTYALEVLCEGELLGSYRIEADEMTIS